MLGKHESSDDRKDDVKVALLKIANYVLYKVWTYAPCTSNSNIIEEESEAQAIHRQLWINTMRARNDPAGIRKLIYSWNIDIKTGRESKYEEGWVKLMKEECALDALATYLEKNADPDEFKIIDNDGSELLEIHCNLTDLNNYVYDEIEPLSSKESRKNGSPYSNKERNESVVKRLAQWGIGNCSDLSQAVIALLMHYPHEGFEKMALPGLAAPISVKVLTINDGDHEFVVINRKKESKLNDPQTWGDNVVILDPWLRECYSLEDALSGKRSSPSVSLIFQDFLYKDLSYKIEDAGLIAEGPSEHWKIKNPQLDIFNLKVRSWGSEEHIPWVDASAHTITRSAPSS